MSEGSSMYTGAVLHRRLRPVRHLLRYRVFSLLLDLDELPRLHRRLRLFSHNRLNLFSFFDRDHGDGNGGELRAWVEGHLLRAGVAADGGTIRVLCYPRILGFVFNPISVYFCERRDGALAAVLYEVNNTFGQRHCYLFALDGDAGRPHACAKALYVSPFNRVDGTYEFRIVPPAQSVALIIRHGDGDGPLLDTWFKGDRAPLDDRSLVKAFLRYPLMTIKVIAGIHWEALKLWRKGLRLVDRPPPPAHAVTVVRAAASLRGG